MSKSYKPISSKYIAIDALRYSKTVSLKSKIDGMNTSIGTNTNALSNIGMFLSSSGSKSCSQGQQNFICTLNISVGTWIVFGHWRQDAYVASSWTSIEGIDFTGPVSTYDSDGYCDMTVIGFHKSGATTAKLNLWPRQKNMTVSGQLYAIRIK